MLFLLFIILLSGNVKIQSQNKLPMNLQKYDYYPIHFGMALGFNLMDFTIHHSGHFFYLDSIYSVENKPTIGLNINIVSNWNFWPNFSLRFLPGLNLGQRNLEYWVRKDTVMYTRVMKIESTYLDFPLLIAFKGSRLNNFRPYLIGGFSIKVDLAAQKRIREEERPKIRLKRFSYYYEIGFGCDYFFPYFKFATELKFAVGLNNVLVPDNTQYSKAIEFMNSKMLMLSFTFEGSDVKFITNFFNLLRGRR